MRETIPNPEATETTSIALTDGRNNKGNRQGGWAEVPVINAPSDAEGSRLKAARQARGLYLGEAARHLGVSVPDYCKLENQTRLPKPPETYDDLLRVLEEE